MKTMRTPILDVYTQPRHTTFRVPLTETERRALVLWLPAMVGVGLLDYRMRGRGTLSECWRYARRRNRTATLVGWTAFAVWFGRHIERD